jgi:hypothetical protein
MADSLFRQTARGREPLATSSEAGDHVHYTPLRRVGIGSITSRRPGVHEPLTFFQMLALRLGVNVAEAKRLHSEGKVL